MNILKKILSIVLIILFIGACIQPAFAVETKISIFSKKVEEDCGCEEIDDKHLVILEKQLNRLEVYSKLLLVLSRFNPEIKEDIQELSNEITILNRMYRELKSKNQFPENLAICIYLLIIYKLSNPINKIMEYIYVTLQKYPFLYLLLYYIILKLYAISFYTVYDALLWGEHYDCWWIDSQQSIFSFLKNNIISSLKFILII